VRLRHPRYTIGRAAIPQRTPAARGVLFDWAESEALTILRNIREAIKPDGRLLLIELVLPEGNSGHLGNYMNLEMLLDFGGRERTEREYREFLSRAGFELTRVVQTGAPVSVVESKPV